MANYFLVSQHFDQRKAFWGILVFLFAEEQNLANMETVSSPCLTKLYSVGQSHSHPSGGHCCH